MSDAVRVAVRVRPFIHEYEKAKGVRNIIRMDKSTQQTFITNPETGAERSFAFDFSYDSFAPEGDPNHASQDTVWQDLGMDVLENAWKGFNVSLFAYGQTGSGKSHSMMGYPGQEGIVPRACREIFDRIARNEDASTSFKVEASMLEIYNEKVKDLFNPEQSKGGLKVRDHPKKGPYVQNLTTMACSSYTEIAKAMEAGTLARTVAATAMNATSSRAHTIFQVIVTQTTVDQAAGKAMDKVSVVSLIDLAGSERADRTGASGDRLKEGCSINKSLSSLGNVIFALSERATNPRKAHVVVPYRDSVLTHLLKNSLGGNAKTVMIAAISPSCVNYDETLSTLRYADRAKQIKNKAVVNEDPNQKLIRGLKEEIEQLRALLAGQAAPGSGGGGAASRPGTADVRRIREEMSENERLLKESEQTWDDKLRMSQNQSELNDAAMAKLGMDVAKQADKQRTTPHIFNLNQDAQMSGVVTYFFEQGLTRVGRRDAATPQNIVLKGLSIQREHATVSRVGANVSVEAAEEDSKVFVNGKRVLCGESAQLASGDRVIFGNNHVFLVVVPPGSSNSSAPSETEAQVAARRAELLAGFSWEDAMNELNESQINTLTEGERLAREKAEQEAKEMQAKVQALERQMAEERARLQEEARAATDAEREKMLEQQQKLETALQAQIDRTNRQQELKDRRRRKQAALEDQILRTLPLLSEANAIAEELDKGMGFAVQLVAATDASKEADPGGLRGAGADADNDAMQTSVDKEDVTAQSLETQLYIRVDAAGKEVPSMWDYEKFINRLYLMREMYEDFVDSGRNMAELEEIYSQDCDPFFDPDEERLIGKAYLLLAPLEFFIDIEDTAPVIQYQGKTDGALDLAISLDPEQIERFENDYTEEEPKMADMIGEQLKITVHIKGAKGLPRKMCSDVTVSYKFFSASHRTPAYPKQTINPRFDHVDRFSIPVTEEFCKYLHGQPLEFQVWGKEPKKDNDAPLSPKALSNCSSSSPVKQKTFFSSSSEKDNGEQQANGESKQEEEDKSKRDKKKKKKKDKKKHDVLEEKQKELTSAKEELGLARQAESKYKESVSQLEQQLAELKKELQQKETTILDLQASKQALESTVEMQKAKSSACSIQ